MTLNLEKHLVEICKQLELDPVLRQLKQDGKLTEEKCQEIRNNANYPSAAAKAEALVTAMSKSDDRAEAFVLVLRKTGQSALADILDPASEHVELKPEEDGEDGMDAGAEEDLADFYEDWKHLAPQQKRRRKRKLPGDMVPKMPNDTTVTSVRSLMMRDVEWTCHGIPSASLTCERSQNWQHMQWCRKCCLYLCTECLASKEHEKIRPRHKRDPHWISVKKLHAMVDAALKEESRESLVSLEKILSDFQCQLRKRIRKELEMSDLHAHFRQHLKIAEAVQGTSSNSAPMGMDLDEAILAAEQAITATTGESSLPARWPEKLDAVKESLLGHSESAASSSSWLGSVSETISQATSKKRAVHSHSATGREGAIETEVSHASPEPLSGIWSIGGSEHEGSVTFWQPESGASQRWDRVLRIPRIRRHQCVAYKNEEVLVIGGSLESNIFEKQNHTSNRHRIQNLATNQHHQLLASTEALSLSSAPSSSEVTPLPVPLTNFAAATSSDGVFACGGSTQELCHLDNLGSVSSEKSNAPSMIGKSAPRNDCYILSERHASQWEAVAPMSVKRSLHTAAALDGCIWALGGLRDSSCEFYTPAVDKWCGFTSLPKETDFAAAISIDKRIMLTGGDADGISKQTLLIDPREGRWSHASDMHRERCHHGLVQWRGRAYALGGSRCTGQGTVEAWEPRTGTWEMVSEELKPELPNYTAYAATE